MFVLHAALFLGIIPVDSVLSEVAGRSSAGAGLAAGAALGVPQEGQGRSSPGSSGFRQAAYLSCMQPCAFAHELSVFEPIFTHGSAYQDSQQSL